MARLRTLLLVMALAACDREARETHNPPVPFSQSQLALTSTVTAGSGPSQPEDPRIKHFEENAFHVSEGHRLYEQFNCADCHGVGGGGGIGVPLIDKEWIYGSSSPQIVATLIQGRPNGMPSFRTRLTEEQMWQIAAWVRAMSAQINRDVLPSRSDGIANTEPLTRMERETPNRSNADAGSR